MSFGCGSMMGGSDVVLSAALQQLKNEHGPLRAQMEAFYIKAQEIGQASDVSNWVQPIRELAELVIAFEAELGPHSEREEGVLFPMMAKYIGRETGPIVVMEYEHDQAKMNLKNFIVSVNQLPEVLEEKQANEMASYAKNAYLILSDHFMKEENVLFPMAERLLTPEDKEELSAAILKA